MARARSLSSRKEATPQRPMSISRVISVGRSVREEAEAPLAGAPSEVSCNEAQPDTASATPRTKATSRNVIKPPKKTGAWSVRIKASPQASNSKNHTHPELSKSARAPDARGLGRGLGQGAWAGLAPVPHHLFLHSLKLLQSLKFLQNLDRAREFGRDVAIVKHGTTVCALARTDRAFLRDAKNFLRFLRAELQSWVGRSISSHDAGLGT